MSDETEELTPIDMAHAAMEAAGDEGAARLRFYERLADAELFLLLTEEALDDNVSPEIFDTEDGRFVLVFDREERLARFAERVAPYAAMSGRILAEMLRGQGVGVGLNLGVAPSAILIPPAAMDWLCDTLSHAPQETEAQISEVIAPGGLPEELITAIDTKLATAVGLARVAYLVGTRDAAGGHGHLLAFVDALEQAEGALAKAASEALTFSGIEAGAMDVGFFTGDDPVTASFAAVGLRFDLPEPAKPEPLFQEAPGSNPAKPPILK